MGCRTLHTLPATGRGELTMLKEIDLFGCEMLKKDDIACIVHGLSVQQYEQVSLILPDGELFMPSQGG